MVLEWCWNGMIVLQSHLSLCGIEGTIPSSLASLSHLNYLGFVIDHWTRFSRIETSLTSLLGVSYPKTCLQPTERRMFFIRMSTIKDCWENEKAGDGEFDLVCCGPSMQSVPSWLNTLPRLQEVLLYGNKLTGSVPPQVGKALRILSLGSNLLSGTVPSSFLSSSSLEYLYVRPHLKARSSY